MSLADDWIGISGSTMHGLGPHHRGVLGCVQVAWRDRTLTRGGEGAVCLRASGKDSVLRWAHLLISRRRLAARRRAGMAEG